MSKVRKYLQGRIVELELEGFTTRASDNYSPELYVLNRLIEFPFEQYPDYCYPGYLLTGKYPIRWRHIEQVIRFCESLLQPKGSKAGKPIRLAGFQVLILACILGPEDPETGRRWPRRCIMTIARKNGKSSLVAQLFLAIISLDVFKLRAQDIHIGAGDKNQASILYDLMEKFILMDRTLGLSRIYHTIPSKKTIVHKKSFSKVICLSSDTFRAHGLNSYAVLLDEFGNIPNDIARKFYGVLTSGFGSQEEPITLVFSTQAPSDNHTFSEFVDHAKRANLEGGDDTATIGLIFDLPKEEDSTGLITKVDPKTGKKGKTVDIYDERNWARSNPALDSLSKYGFKRVEDMRKKSQEAQRIPTMESQFRNLQLNQRVSAITPFLSQQAWERVLVECDLAEQDTSGPCYLGIDLSSRRDLTAVARVWLQDDDSYLADVSFWVPGDTLQERLETDKVPFDVWAQLGFINVVPGSSIDYEIVAERVVQDTEQYLVEKIAFDRWRMDVLQKEMKACGFDRYMEDDDPIWRKVGQGFRDMTPILETAVETISKPSIRIIRNPCLTWCVSNAVEVKDAADGRKLDKSKSYGRIDGLVALVMALYAAAEDQREARAGERDSEYERGEELLIL